MADRVFEDRVGLWVVNLPALGDRLPRIRTFRGGLIRDVFLPRSASSSDVAAVRNAGLNAHIWAAVDGLDSAAYAARALEDLARLGNRGLDANLELGADAPLPGYVVDVVRRIRVARPGLRLRVNLAAWKGFAVPASLLASDPNLYVAMQNYLGNMEELLSPLDVARDAEAYGAPAAKLTVVYAAASQVLGSAVRERTLPDLSRLHRGTIFHDDLMAEVGLL